MKAEAAFSQRRLGDDFFVTWQSLSVRQKENFLPPDDSIGIAQSMSTAAGSTSALHAVSNRDVHSPSTSTVNPVPHASPYPASLACASSDQRPLDPGSGQRRYSGEEYQNKSNIQRCFCHLLPNLQLPELDVGFMS